MISSQDSICLTGQLALCCRIVKTLKESPRWDLERLAIHWKLGLHTALDADSFTRLASYRPLPAYQKRFLNLLENDAFQKPPQKNRFAFYV